MKSTELPMTHWRATLSYDGTPYHGWQIQPSRPTVQATLAQAIHHITGETVLPQGSGRTDTGVHALAQVASFTLQSPIPAPNLHRALNRALPPSIRILALTPAPPHFHARHSALRKTYEYRIFPHAARDSGKPDLICSPMLAPWVWDCRWPLDLVRMQQAAPLILGTHDFTSFAASDPDLTTRTSESPVHATNIRTIFHSCWQQQNDLYLYRVTGSGFLHHMVRNLVGTFVDIGAGRIPPEAVSRILATRNRSTAGPTAPAQGLFLVEVEY
jgi:tRNA pseudouridine38-40 synthase